MLEAGGCANRARESPAAAGVDGLNAVDGGRGMELGSLCEALLSFKAPPASGFAGVESKSDVTPLNVLLSFAGIEGRADADADAGAAASASARAASTAVVFSASTCWLLVGVEAPDAVAEETATNRFFVRSLPRSETRRLSELLLTLFE